MSQQPNYSLRNCKVISSVVIGGTYLVITAIICLLWLSFTRHHDERVFASLGVCAFAAGYIIVAHMLARRGYHQLVAYLLSIFYLVLATGIIWTWGINTPIAPLIFGLVIVLAGILLTARHALFAALVISIILCVVQAVISLGWHYPNTAWTGNDSSFGDVLAYSVVFSMLALISWLYNREMERSLHQAKKAEAALLRQKATLEQQVAERTAELRRSQLAEMRQMYRFAELGQMGVTLLHDLANHLTALTLEIEGLQSSQQSKDIARAKEITGYLEGIVENTRARLHGEDQKQSFNVIQKMNQTIAFLRYKAAEADVAIVWKPPAKSWKYIGDPAGLSQVIAIITNNAIDAFGHIGHQQHKQITISVQRDARFLVIKISDNGKGIARADRKILFQPFRSTKKTGLGLGLFIAKQTIETNFSGTIELNPWSKHTEFIIKLPHRA